MRNRPDYATRSTPGWQRDPGARHPFKRINRLITIANEASASGDREAMDAALDELKKYKSRGHGKGPGMQVQAGSKSKDRSKYNQKQCYSEGKR